jgi:hypothetical protein
MFENPTASDNALCSSCAKIACCLPFLLNHPVYVISLFYKMSSCHPAEISRAGFHSCGMLGCESLWAWSPTFRGLLLYLILKNEGNILLSKRRETLIIWRIDILQKALYFQRQCCVNLKTCTSQLFSYLTVYLNVLWSESMSSNVCRCDWFIQRTFCQIYWKWLVVWKWLMKSTSLGERCLSMYFYFMLIRIKPRQILPYEATAVSVQIGLSYFVQTI